MLSRGQKTDSRVLFDDNISSVAMTHRPFHAVFVASLEGRPCYADSKQFNREIS
jgi:hypothetical protein